MTPGLCSILMPCFNRAAFLADAIASIRAQTFPNWELVVVDDGSTDDTRATLERLLKSDAPSQAVRYVHQANGGAYAARNAGLNRARGEFIAFFDSDDVWLPHHLADGVGALQNHPELDWVYADARKIDHATGKVVVERGFHEGGRPHPMLALRTKNFDRLRIYDDPGAVACQLRHNLNVLLQTSVIRHRVFASRRFVDHYRNEGEDELFPIRVMKAGFRLGYLDDVHLIYHMHGDNSSSAAIGMSADKRLRVFAAAVRGYEELGREVSLTGPERRALRERLAGDYFWKRGYAVLWQGGRSKEAWAEFHKGLKYQPTDWRMWKTYLACRLKAILGRAPRGAGA